MFVLLKDNEISGINERELEQILVRRIRNAKGQGYTHILKTDLIKNLDIPYNTTRRVIGLIGSTGSNIIETKNAAQGAIYPIDQRWNDEELDYYINKPPRPFDL